MPLRTGMAGRPSRRRHCGPLASEAAVEGLAAGPGELSASYCTSKPGKVAYAMYYFHNVLGNAPPIVCP